MKKNLSKNVLAIASFIGLLVLIIAPRFSTAVRVPYDNPSPIAYTVLNNPMVITLTANPQTMTLPTNSTTLTWTTTDSPDSCSAFGSWTGIKASGGGSEVISGLTAGGYVYDLVCFKAGFPNAMASVTVIVNGGAGNLPPTANAGPDQTIVTPANSITAVGSGSDPDGTITSYQWSQVGTLPAVANITPSNTATTFIDGLSALGVYTFELLVTDNGGSQAVDQMTVTVQDTPPTGATGTLVLSNSGVCTIPLNGSTCTVDATWVTSGATLPRLINTNTGAILSTLPNSISPLPVTVTYPTTQFRLKNGPATLDSKMGTANCGGNTWDGTKCAATPPKKTDGVCGATHNKCTAGTSANPSGTGPWTWDCLGINGGANASPSCFEDVGPSGKPQCTDGVDNDKDGLIDAADPGCHTDANPANPASYDPMDNNEGNSKIKQIEI